MNVVGFPFGRAPSGGERGPPGSQGERGIPGPQGERGLPGPQGERGPAGSAGPSGGADINMARTMRLTGTGTQLTLAPPEGPSALSLRRGESNWTIGSDDPALFLRIANNIGLPCASRRAASCGSTG